MFKNNKLFQRTNINRRFYKINIAEEEDNTRGIAERGRENRNKLIYIADKIKDYENKKRNFQQKINSLRQLSGEAEREENYIRKISKLIVV